MSAFLKKIVLFLSLSLILTPLPTFASTAHDVNSLEPTPDTSLVAPDRGYLGYYGRYEQSSAGGWIRVVGVEAEGPADAAGLEKDDLIIKFNDAGFTFANDLEMNRGLSWIKEGVSVELTILRGIKMETMKITPAKMTNQQRQALASWLESAVLWFEGGESQRCLEKKASLQKEN